MDVVDIFLCVIGVVCVLILCYYYIINKEILIKNYTLINEEI